MTSSRLWISLISCALGEGKTGAVGGRVHAVGGA
jgi:hypothetical protein